VPPRAAGEVYGVRGDRAVLNKQIAPDLGIRAITG